MLGPSHHPYYISKTNEWVSNNLNRDLHDGGLLNGTNV